MRAARYSRRQMRSGPLVLVNRQHPLAEEPRQLLTAADERYPNILLERQAARLLAACIQAAGGAREIVPVSGWRSQAEQQAIWEDTLQRRGEAFTRQYVAVPGCSEHQTGLAIDLGRAAREIDFIRPDFPEEGACGRFRRLAPRYGFIQRYHREKESLTGIACEPWHYRYVGTPHALLMEREGLCRVACRKLGLPQREPDLAEWTALVQRINGVHKTVQIALVGKYTGLHDAYLSVAESLFHAGTACDARVNIKWVDSESLTAENVEQVLGDCSGILVPGGFGDRGIEGMVLAAQYAREKDVPYFGICLGMQIAVIEYARHVAGWADAHSAEFSGLTAHPVIALMPDQVGITAKGGTMRLGKYPCVLAEGTLARAAYGAADISERHRHRYEFNNQFRQELQDAGLRLAGLSPDGHLVEIVEEPANTWFVGVQFHPEFKSRPNRPHPLFVGFVQASLDRQG